MDLAEIEQTDRHRRNRRRPRAALHRRRPPYQAAHCRSSRRGARRRHRPGRQLPHRRRLPRGHLRSHRNPPRPLALPYISAPSRPLWASDAPWNSRSPAASFPAAEARELGLVHEVAEDAAARALEIARTVAASSPTALRRNWLRPANARNGLAMPPASSRREARNRVFARSGFPRGPHAPSARNARPAGRQARG